MIKTFPIEFVRCILLKTFLEAHIKDENLFGGDNQINLFSFYEQVKSQEDVDRYVEKYRDLVEQQNRTNLIGNGVLVSPENPTITNLYSCLIVPMTWTCSIRTRLDNRDQMLETLYHAIEELKGSKVDVAQLKCVDEHGKYYYLPFPVNTCGHNDGQPSVFNGCYIGDFAGTPTETQVINRLINTYERNGYTINLNTNDYVYYGNDNKIKVALVTSGNKTISVTSTLQSQDLTSDIMSVRYLLESVEEYSEIPVNINVTGTFELVDDYHSTTLEAKGVITSTSIINDHLRIYVTFSLGERDEWDFGSQTTKNLDPIFVGLNVSTNFGIAVANLSMLSEETYTSVVSVSSLSYIVTLTDGTRTETYEKTLSNPVPTLNLNRLSFTDSIGLGEASEWDTANISVSSFSGTYVVTKAATFSYTLTSMVVKSMDISLSLNVQDDGTYEDIIFPPSHIDFEKYKVSMSFESLRCDEPRTLDGEEYCEISFGGSATIVNKGVMLGNDLVKVGISRVKVIGETTTYLDDSEHLLEPLELPSGNNANTNISQLISNDFKQNTHTDGLNITLQYSFVLDTNESLIEAWFMYARYGTYALSNAGITPNMIYSINEYWSSWGEVTTVNSLGKIIEDMTIENTESDTLTINVNFQVQGEHN